MSGRTVGTQHLKLELGLPGVRLQAIEFGGWTGTPPASRVRAAYRLAPDDYRGGEAIQLIVVHRESLDCARGSGGRLRRGRRCSFGLGSATLGPDTRPPLPPATATQLLDADAPAHVAAPTHR